MKTIRDRTASFIAVTAVYLLAVLLGILLYRKLPWNMWLNLLAADMAATFLTFVFSLLFRNASVYDPYWSVQPPVILWALAAGRPMNALQACTLAAVTFWALRLTANWAYTFHGLHCQDWRYTMLKEKTGVFYPLINFTGIHMVPTLVVYGCTLPAAYVIVLAPVGSALAFAPLCLSLGAALLQGTADIQMHRFRKTQKGGFIRSGLWKHSRHPNYLGEILMWWGIGLSAWAALPHMPWLLTGAVANTLLFICVSIPMAEKRQGQKPGYSQYKKETHYLLPLPK